jgi:hypothetical protein
MQRESDKQGGARSDRLREETKDLAAGGEPVRVEDGGDRPEGPARQPVRGVSPIDVARRAELTRHLPPSEFPADRRRLLSRLRGKKAPRSVIEAVSELPDDREFRTIGEIVRAIGLRTGPATSPAGGARPGGSPPRAGSPESDTA